MLRAAWVSLCAYVKHCQWENCYSHPVEQARTSTPTLLYCCCYSYPNPARLLKYSALPLPLPFPYPYP